MDKNLINYHENLSFLISLFIYFALVFCGVFWIKNSNEIFQKYTNSKDSFMEISLVEENIEENIIEKTEQIEEKISEISTEQVKPQIDIKNLANFKSQKLTDNLKKQNKKIAKNSGSSGIYDEYIGEVQNKLTALWSNYQKQAGNDAVIQITFDSLGNVIDTKIIRLSYDTEFNKKLKDFLFNLQNVKFPKPPKSPYDFLVNMKDLEKLN